MLARKGDRDSNYTHLSLEAVLPSVESQDLADDLAWPGDQRRGRQGGVMKERMDGRGTSKCARLPDLQTRDF